MNAKTWFYSQSFHGNLAFSDSKPQIVDMAVCLSCGVEEFDVPMVETELGPRLRKKCRNCGGQLVSNPRRG